MDGMFTITAMADAGNIVITDESALRLLLNCDIARRAELLEVADNPLRHLATKPQEMASFNLENPIYGPHPVKLLVTSDVARRRNLDIECRVTGQAFPRGSFIKLREALYVTSAELTFARMADRLSDVRLAEIATSLCGRYFLCNEGVEDRTAYLTNVSSLRNYLEQLPLLRGKIKAIRALSFAMDNSASPMEGKTMLQFCLPVRQGGYGLPFDRMNFDIKAGRCHRLAEQGGYCVDLASTKYRVAIEYDGSDHNDASKDKRRRNALAALGWTVFPLEKDVLNSPARTEQFALQVAKFIGRRIQRRPSWDEAFVSLRHELELPV